MSFNPIFAAESIKNSYHEYVKSTFYIRDESFRRIFEDILDQYSFSKGPYIEATGTFKKGESIRNLVREGLLSEEFSKLLTKDKKQYERALFIHQEKAIRNALENKNMIITSGTGSGKTECYLYPLLNLLFRENEKGCLKKGVYALLLYPMNALANDQMKRLRKILEYYPDITFGGYTGETKETEKAARSHYLDLYGEEPHPNELISREKMKESPPHIMITNYAMLEYLLLRPADNVFFHGEYADHWKYIVLDEAHTYRGATGMEVSVLLRRLLHTLSNNNEIRFLLTSATLGDTTVNEGIINFAKRLCCGLNFSNECIIRAERDPIPEVTARKRIHPRCYNVLSNLIDKDGMNDINKIETAKKELFQENLPTGSYEKYQEWIYAFLEQDFLTYDFRKLLQEGTLPLLEISDILSLKPEELQNFIRLANYASKDSSKLLDIRYHHFIRTLEGAYVTFKPEKTLTVEPRTEVEFNNEVYKCFKISVCQYCGEIYLFGYIRKDNGKFEQNKNNNGNYYIVIGDNFLQSRTDEDGDEEKYLKHMYTLCCKCGAIYKTYSANPSGKCSCGSEHSINIFEIKLNAGQLELHRCEYCKATNPRGSIIRGFYIGQNAAAAVIGSTLYEQMPIKQLDIIKKKSGMGKVRESKEIKDTKQLLIFSDSRQEAAYFAPYFEFTYQNIIRRRILYQSAIELCEFYKEDPIPFTKLHKRVSQNLELSQHVDAVNADKEAWKVLMYEMRSQDRNGLVNLGMLSFTVDSDFDEGYETFSLDELRTIDIFLMNSFLIEGAIMRPQCINLTEEDIKYYMYHGRESVFMPGKQNTNIKAAGKDIKYWLAKSSNSRMDYLKRTGVFKDNVDIERFLTEYWDGKNEVNLKCDSGLYTLDSEKIYIRVSGCHEDLNWYRCDVCGRVTSLNYKNVCPHFRCKGILHSEDTKTLKSYFQNQLSKSKIFPMRVREHTAQLSHDRASDYQEAFINGDINVLSCSTTFEMGVDVGDLETIFMRNMPPNPSNYIQRAGRAGRRIDSAAFALTFCRLSNHDLTFFNTPQRMINGIISPPIFKIDNEKIIRRHLYAVLFASFWRRFPHLKTVSELMNEKVFQDYLIYLKAIPTATMDYIKNFVPEDISLEIIMTMIENLYNEEGPLLYAKEEYNDELFQIETIRQELIREEKYGRQHENLDRVKRTIEETKIIEFLSRNNLIPKYGFPVDTVELRTDLLSLKNYSSKSNLKLQRDLFQAITDYAPGAEVIADGMMYTSQYIKRPFRKDHDWHQYDFGVCSNPECGTITVKRHLGDDNQSALIHEKCCNCGSKYKYQTNQNFIVPSYGFIVSTDLPQAVKTKKPRHMARTQIHYMGGIKDKKELTIRKYLFGELRITVATSKDDELAVINRSSFYVCKTCGYAEEISSNAGQPFKTIEHKNPNGRNCYSKKLENLSIGHTFKTDVTKLTVNKYLEEGPAYSILFALLEGLSSFFDIERNDIDGCLFRNKAESGSWSTVFILFDKVPGGAGNANRLGQLSTRFFRDFLFSCYSIVNNCNCGEKKDGNAACYSCLCNYGNQYYHEILKRKFAMDFFSSLLGLTQETKKEIRVVTKVAMSIKELTDHTYDDLLDKLESYEEPEAYYELTNYKGECIGQADIAWILSKIAIIEGPEKSVWEEHGWSVFQSSESQERLYEIIKEIIC